MMDVAAAWRIGVAVGLFVLFAGLEFVWPDRARVAPRWRRWLTNAALFAAGVGVIRVLAPLGLVGAALWAQDAGIGIFNGLAIPSWAAMTSAVLLLDFALYWQHRAMHAVPILWRVHAPHHADPDLDVTTGVRFHPAEFVISFLYKLAFVIVLGAPPLAVLIFEIALNAFSKFNHANIAWPAALDRLWRNVIITPRAHRLHHEAEAGMRSGNYGFSIVAWDWLFGTFVSRTEPKTLGVRGVSVTEGITFWKSFWLPARREPPVSQ